MRGTVDQTPIIVEATPGAFKAAAPPRPRKKRSSDRPSLKSTSSSDSLGPPTPPESTNVNLDRRYVWQPEKDIHIPVSYDDPKPEKRVQPAKREGEKDKKHQAQAGKQRKDEPLSSNTTTKPLANNPTPLVMARESSPYTFSPGSGKSSLSGLFLATPNTPNTLSPLGRSLNGEFQNHHSPISPHASTDFQSRMRAHSANSTERPEFARHVSLSGYPSQPNSPHVGTLTSSPIKPKSSWPTVEGIDDSSEDSDISSDEYWNKNEKSHRNYHSRSTGSRKTPKRHQDDYRSSGKLSQYPGRERLVSHQSGSFERLPAHDPKDQPSSVPITTSLPHRASMGATSLRQSGYSSPDRSPPRSPRPDSYKHNGDIPAYATTSRYNNRARSPITFSQPPGRRSKPTSRPNSQPTSPLLSPRIIPKSTAPDSYDLGLSGLSSPLGIPLPKSRQVSPLPSPAPDSPLNTKARLDVKSPSLAKNRTSNTSGDIHPRRPRDISLPAATSPPGFLPTLGVPQSRRTHPSAGSFMADTEQKRKSSEVPPSPIRSHTSTSIPVVKAKPTLPDICQRGFPMSRFDDWSAIPECRSINICPDCRKAIQDQGYKGRFISNPPRAAGEKIRCDISDRYMRLGWNQLLRGLAPPTLILDLMAAVQDEQDCPGKQIDVRSWYRVWNPETCRYVSEFMVCSCCVRRIELLYPSLQSTILHPLPGQHASICDLRSDSHRFPRYLDTLSHIVADAETYRRPPNLFAFVQLAKIMSETRECLRDDQLLHVDWHFPATLPDFTVCAECFAAVVGPHLDAGSDIASAMSPTSARPPHLAAVSCQLYSPRMRAVFAEACARRDFGLLATEVTRRVAVERDLQKKMARLPPEKREGEEAAALIREWKRWE